MISSVLLENKLSDIKQRHIIFVLLFELLQFIQSKLTYMES